VKKIAIALVATATLALAACGDNNKAESNTSNVSETVNEGLEDLGNAANVLESQAENLGDTAENLADAGRQVVENATDATANAH